MNRDDRAGRERPPGVPASFALVWDAIADVIGTAATAALLRRAAKRASARYPTLGELTIARRTFTPEYELPAAWLTAPTGAATVEQFQALLDELVLLLHQLTGVVVLRRLAHLSLPLGRLQNLGTKTTL